MNIYKIYDTVACEYGPIFEAKNDGTALRKHKGFLEKEGLFGDEYQLWSVGTSDSETGVVTGTIPEQVSINIKAEA